MKSKRSKLASRAQKLKLIGYQDNKNYRLWNPDDERISISPHVTFDESTVINSDGMHVNSSDEYIIDSIIGEREIDGEKQYLVCWHGYTDDDNTWEPIENVVDTEALQLWNNLRSPRALLENIILLDDAVISKDEVMRLDDGLSTVKIVCGSELSFDPANWFTIIQS